MGATATMDEASLIEEARLAREAAAGDGNAFAALYERYERRAFNLAYRIVGSEDAAAGAVEDAFLGTIAMLPRVADRELAFGPHLLAATRSAAHGLSQRRPPPSNAAAEQAAPLALEGEHTSGDREGPGEPDGPSAAQQEEIRAANMRLPERQREALALRELEDLSYGEIATIMEANPGAVAQLISRARINLNDELEGNALASIAAPSAECERALPLIAMREDGQLEAGSRDAGWLDAHLIGCDRCRLAVEAMREGGASYRLWAPIAVVPWLFNEIAAKAAALTGADWGGAAAEAGARSPAAPPPGMPPAYGPRGDAGASRRRRATVAGGLVGLLLMAGLAAAVTRDDPPAEPARSAAEAAPAAGAAGKDARAKGGPGGKKDGAAAQKKNSTKGSRPSNDVASEPSIAAETTFSSPQPSSSGGAPDGGGSNGSSGTATVQSPKRASAPTSAAKQKPAPAPAPAPQPAPAPVVEAPAPTEEPSGHEPPGKPADRPPSKGKGQS